MIQLKSYAMQNILALVQSKKQANSFFMLNNFPLLPQDSRWNLFSRVFHLWIVIWNGIDPLPKWSFR